MKIRTPSDPLLSNDPDNVGAIDISPIVNGLVVPDRLMMDGNQNEILEALASSATPMPTSRIEPGRSKRIEK